MTDPKILLVQKFYKAFADGNAEGMVSCYADDIEFTDPAFGTLKGDDAKNMWRMLLKNKDIEINAYNIKTDGTYAKARWEAHYTFSRTGRPVVNKVLAWFEFNENGKISSHTDHFDIWVWTKQAFGFWGYLLGWTPFMQKKIQKRSRGVLKDFKRKE